MGVIRDIRNVSVEARNKSITIYLKDGDYLELDNSDLNDLIKGLCWAAKVQNLDTKQDKMKAGGCEPDSD